MVLAGVMGEPECRIYFEFGSEALPSDASNVLATVADVARAQAGKVVLISGFHDASGDAAQNADLAKRRAQKVRHALGANGVAPDYRLLDQPLVMTGGATARFESAGPAALTEPLAHQARFCVRIVMISIAATRQAAPAANRAGL